jgi:hypothetical protein
MIRETSKDYCNDDLEFNYNGIDYMADVTARVIENEYGQEWVEITEALFYVGTPDEWILTELTPELQKVLEDKILVESYKEVA